MKTMKTIFLSTSTIVFATLLTLSGCTKHEPFVNIEFDCECGTLNLDGRDLTVRLAEGYAPETGPSPEDPVLWKYFVVADFRTENEVTYHAPSHDLEFSVNFESMGGSTTLDAAIALHVKEIELPNLDVEWTILGGTVKVVQTDSIHTLSFTDVQVGNNDIINAELTIVPQ
ncbi:MAG: hypothetical protein H8E97_03075 [Bacteroidetes bacterium]|jgi:hypothetical protein|nr:hypothetical protein [Bacteroidota bacterium]